jgi:hypothetical protein
MEEYRSTPVVDWQYDTDKLFIVLDGLETAGVVLPRPSIIHEAPLPNLFGRSTLCCPRAHASSLEGFLLEL